MGMKSQGFIIVQVDHQVKLKNRLWFPIEGCWGNPRQTIMEKPNKMKSKNVKGVKVWILYMNEVTLKTENEIIRQAQDGEQEAFNQLVYQYREKTIQIIYRMCADECLAEDAAQVAFLKVWQQLSQFKPGTSFRNWLYRIAINTAIDLLRRERDQLDIDSVSVAAPGGSMTDWLVQQERQGLVRKAILELPEASRAVLQMC